MEKIKMFIRVSAVFIVAIGGSMMLFGCQYATRYWGGTTTLNLPPDRKLMEITWKDDTLWYLSREMRDDEVAESYEFKEHSDWTEGGKVIINELEG